MEPMRMRDQSEQYLTNEPADEETISFRSEPGDHKVTGPDYFRNS